MVDLHGVLQKQHTNRNRAPPLRVLPKRCNREIDTNPYVLQRHDPEYLSSIKGLEIIWCPLCVQQDAANQEARKDEESIHTRPAHLKSSLHPGYGPDGDQAQIEIKQDKQDGDAAKAVQLWDAFLAASGGEAAPPSLSSVGTRG
jgi:hypothetical protein